MAAGAALTRRLACAALAAVFLPLAALPVHAGEAELDSLLSELAPPPSDQALAQIPEFGRKLLALRSYVRYGERIKTRWSWTDEQIAAFKASEAHTVLRAEIAADQRAFQGGQSGLRDLCARYRAQSRQPDMPSGTRTSLSARRRPILKPPSRQKFADAGKVKLEELRTWLRGYRPPKRANLAAPGLTLHGRASAIDFQVMKDGAIYAGANSRQVETVWRAEGWDTKLQASIAAAGPSFTGPLKNPDEPWHFTYTPADSHNTQ
jgi:hypothetical protein